MTETTHTPGPWAMSRDSWGGYDIVGPRGEDIGYANSNNGADEPPEQYPVQANARLMAAAPDLLVSLQEMSALVKNLWEGVPWAKTFSIDFQLLNEAPIRAARALEKAGG